MRDKYFRRLICRLVSARSHDTETLCGHLKLSDIDEVSQGQGLVIMVNR